MTIRKAFSYLLVSSGVLILILVFVFMVAMQVKASQVQALIGLGKQIFRYDTFGDEDFWGGTLKLHQAIEGAQFGGVGPAVSPARALIGFFNTDGSLQSFGIQCVLCHSTMIDANAPGIGKRLDGWANRDLNYRTTSLHGLWTHTKGGFDHNGQFATLNALNGGSSILLNYFLYKNARHILK